MNDGSGDYGWTENLVEYLINRNIPVNKIKLIYTNAYDYGNDIVEYVTKPTKTNLTEFNKPTVCKILKVSTLNPNDSVTQYIFKKEKYDDMNEFKKEICEKNKKINEFDDKVYTSSSLTPSNFNDINSIFNEIISGRQNVNTSINIGDIFCEIIKEQKIDIPNELLNGGQPGFPISKLTNLIKKYPTIQIYYFNAFAPYQDFTTLDIFNNSINLTFITQEHFEIKNQIAIREGGHDTDGAINCSANYGYIQAKPEGDEVRFRSYFDSLGINPTKTCISYISTGETSIIPDKLAKFIKILCLSTDYNYDPSDSSTIYSILMVSEYNRIFPDRILNIDSDIKISRVGTYYQAEFNNKKINIIKGGFVNLLTHGFNFAYLLHNTNPYCYLSGDNSYMEGLTLNKKVIHVGMGNKYSMIQQLQNLISNELEIKNLCKYESIDEIRSTIKNNLPEKFLGYNIQLSKYADYISHPRYLEIQGRITSKNFYDELDIKVNELVISRCNTLRNKYLKYKQKYIQLKKSMGQ